MTEHEEHPETHDQHEHESHGSTGQYMAVFVSLCILTLCSFWTYSPLWPDFLDNDSIKRLFMMAVSVTKAMLVIMFFMHLLWEANWKYVLTIPATCMSVFLVLALVPDVALRYRHASRERMLHAAEVQSAQEESEADGEHPDHESGGH